MVHFRTLVQRGVVGVGEETSPISHKIIASKKCTGSWGKGEETIFQLNWLLGFWGEVWV